MFIVYCYVYSPRETLKVASERKKAGEQPECYKLQASVKRPASKLNAWEKTMEHEIDRREKTMEHEQQTLAE
jgi:hypothetical protein